MNTYRIIPLPLTIIELDMAVFTYRFNYGKKVRLPITSWYIEGADKRILVDTAADAKLATQFRGIPSEEIATFDDALAGLGLKPDDIDIVIQTHLQWDHCANTNKCKRAKVVVQEEEVKSALAPHPILAPTYKKNLLTGLNFLLVRGGCEIVPGIDLIPTPGHTPGCQSVSINTTQGKAIITGFCCLKENFGPPEGAHEDVIEVTPVIAPGIHLDARDGFDSALLVKSMADIIIPNHDPSFAKMKSIP